MPGPKKKRRERAQAARRRAGQRPVRPSRQAAPATAVAGRAGGPAAQGPGVAQVTPATSEARPAAPGGPADGTPGWAERALQEVLTVTYWFDPGEHGEPYPVTMWFSGRRAGVTGKPKPGDTFTREETVHGIVPGSGPVAVTATVRDINPGEWIVTARPVRHGGSHMVGPSAPARDGEGRGGRRELWPRRIVIPAGPPAPAGTALLPFTKVPGIIRFAYSGLVFLGVLAGLGLQAVLLSRAHLPAGPALVLSVSAVVAGVAGAKIYYVAVHRGRRFDGWCIQGFVLGAAAVIAAALPLVPLGIPAGTFLAAAAPGLLIGMSIGRPGCFWAGCCVGRPTASRWGIWSSDRRIGARRIPAQPLEALLALAAGLAALLTVVQLGLGRSGAVAVAALAAYTLGRQFLLGLRAEPPRRWRLAGPVTAAAAAAALIASVTVLALGAA